MTPATSALAVVQRAIYERLSADVELPPVYDEVPENAECPYVVIGEATETPANWHGGFGRETVVSIHVWSRHAGFSEATAIADRVTALLDHQPLPLPDRAHLATRFEFSQTLRDPDPQIRHVPMRFRVSTEQQ